MLAIVAPFTTALTVCLQQEGLHRDQLAVQFIARLECRGNSRVAYEQLVEFLKVRDSFPLIQAWITR